MLSSAGASASTLALLAVLGLSAGPAFAAEPKEVADALGQALASKEGATFTYQSADADGDDIVVNGLSIKQPAEGGTVTFAETTISGAEDAEDGGFTAETISMSDGTLTGDGQGKIASAELEGVTVFSKKTIDEKKLSQGVVYESASAENIQFTPKDQTAPITVASAEITLDNVVDGKPTASEGTVSSIVVPGALMKSPQFDLASIGYDNLALDITWKGSQTPAGDLSIDTATLALKDGGKLSLTGSLKGVPVNETADSMDATKLMGVMVEKVTLRYDDQSLTTRLLDFFAKQQNMEGKAYGEQLAGAVPFFLMSLNNQAFQDQVGSAVATFLRDPKSLSITLAPTAPITGADIMQAAQTDLPSLPDKLGIKVEANTSN